MRGLRFVLNGIAPTLLHVALRGFCRLSGDSMPRTRMVLAHSLIAEASPNGARSQRTMSSNVALCAGVIVVSKSTRHSRVNGEVGQGDMVKLVKLTNDCMTTDTFVENHAGTTRDPARLLLIVPDRRPTSFSSSSTSSSPSSSSSPS
jgi:hypothetical protein